MMITRAVTVLLEDRLITFTRAVGLLRRRNLPVRSLAVGPTVTPGVSRLTIMIQSDEATADRAVQQLQKVVGVRGAAAFPARDGVSRELALVKVTAGPDKRAEIMQISDIFRGKIIDVSDRTLTIEVTGTVEKIDAFQSLLSPYGIKELVRTGKIALTRGARTTAEMRSSL